MRVAHYFGKSVWNIFNMKASFAAMVATSVTVVGAIIALTNFMVNFVDVVFNLYNAVSALVYTIKYNGFKYSGFSFWFGIGLEVVGTY